MKEDLRKRKEERRKECQERVNGWQNENNCFTRRRERCINMVDISTLEIIWVSSEQTTIAGRTVHAIRSKAEGCSEGMFMRSILSTTASPVNAEDM